MHAVCVCYKGIAGQSNNAISHMALGRSIMMNHEQGSPISKSRLSGELMMNVDVSLEVDAVPSLLKQPSRSATGQSSLPSIADMFVDVSDAELHLTPLLDHASSYHQQIRELAQSRIKRSSQPPSCHVVRNVLALCVSRKVLSTCRDLARLAGENMVCLQRWDAAMNRFLLDDSSPKTRHTILLQIRHAHAILMIRLLISLDDTLLDDYDTVMSQLLDFCQAYVSLTPAYPPSRDRRAEDSATCRGGYCLDSRVIPAIHLVAAKCRHPGIRRRAVQMLATMDRREALHSSVIAASTAAAIVSLEEGRALELRASPSGNSSVPSHSHSAASVERADQIPKAARFTEGVFVTRADGSVEIWCGSWASSVEAEHASMTAIEVRRYLARLDWCGKDAHDIAINLAKGTFPLAAFGEPLMDGVYMV